MNRELLLAISFAFAPCCSFAQEPKDIASLLKAKGVPVFLARSADVRGNLIICKALEFAEPGKDRSDKRFHGRVLLYCDSWDALWISVALSNQQMNRATPFMGLEKPGAKLADMAPPKSIGPVALLRPASVFMATVNEKGTVVRTASIVVQKLQDAE